MSEGVRFDSFPLEPQRNFFTIAINSISSSFNVKLLEHKLKAKTPKTNFLPGRWKKPQLLREEFYLWRNHRQAPESYSVQEDSKLHALNQSVSFVVQFLFRPIKHSMISALQNLSPQPKGTHFLLFQLENVFILVRYVVLSLSVLCHGI